MHLHLKTRQTLAEDLWKVMTRMRSMTPNTVLFLDPEMIIIPMVPVLLNIAFLLKLRLSFYYNIQDWQLQQCL